MVFYAQSTSIVTSGRKRERERDKKQNKTKSKKSGEFKGGEYGEKTTPTDINPFTAMLAAQSLGKRPIKCQI